MPSAPACSIRLRASPWSVDARRALGHANYNTGELDAQAVADLKPLRPQKHAPRTRAPRVAQNHASRIALAVLLGCLALLATAPIADATGFGVVSGKVTGAVSKTGIEGIEVRVYKGENEWYPTTTTRTSTRSY
jgi:hypothetical protein